MTVNPAIVEDIASGHNGQSQEQRPVPGKPQPLKKEKRQRPKNGKGESLHSRNVVPASRRIPLIPGNSCGSASDKAVYAGRPPPGIRRPQRKNVSPWQKVLLAH